ncbi:AAA family ATPase, partial [Amycolatopsis sp. NPDC000740]|uniref:ATP-binding protein n=1 Tax=Amycolatopsis sp. NPDC000740 TaxID=3154269 RepID=UPI00331B46A6
RPPRGGRDHGVRPPVNSGLPAAPQRKHVGRTSELSFIRTALGHLTAGRGGVVWIDGEPGIGKSALLAAALQDVPTSEDGVAWGSCDEISQRVPLGVLLDCLGITTDSADPRRAETARALREDVPRPGAWYASDPVLAAVDQVLSLVDVLCADAPLILVLDDVQWADDVSLLAWRRLLRVTSQAPLLLIAAARPVPARVEVDRLREAVDQAGGTLLPLGPLPEASVRELVTHLLKARPGPRLRRLVGRAGGNPLYFRQVVETLIEDGAVTTEAGVADIDEATLDNVPATIASAIWRKLNFLDPDTREVLQWAAMLGVDFALSELSVVTGKPASQLMPTIVEALTAGVLAAAGYRFAFRHSLLRHSLYESLPAALRLALHRQAAEALAAAGSPVERVVEQLLATPAEPDAWVAHWLITNTDAIAKRSPGTAVDLLRAALGKEGMETAIGQSLGVRLVQLLFWLGRDPTEEARAIVEVTSDPAVAAEMRWLLAYIDYRRGDVSAAALALEDVTRALGVPLQWRARCEALLAMVQRAGQGDLVAAEVTATSALQHATDVNDVFAMAYALEVLWQVESVRRNHRAALDYVDRSLDAVAGSAEYADLQLSLLDNRILSLQNLDRLDDAGEVLTAAQDMVVRRSSPGGMHITAATHYYWIGQWDDVLVELAAAVDDGLERTFFGTRDRSPIRQLYGVGALIAGRRGVIADMAAYLEEAEQYQQTTVANRESGDFLLAAEALAAEQRGDVAGALELLAPVLNREYAQMMLRHQWLPTIVRLALEIGDADRAQSALAVAGKEAAMESTPARAWCAEAWCRGLIDGSPEPLIEAAARYRSVGRRIELAAVLEDIAVVHGQRGDIIAAEHAFREARAIFTQLRAAWDISRGEARVQQYGIRRVILPAEGRSDAELVLAPIEFSIAELIAAGFANPAIAAQLRIPRLAVQNHVARIMEKLEVDSRNGIAHWVLTRSG